MLKKLVLLLFVIVIFVAAQNNNDLEINEWGGITWKIGNRLPHYEHIEMSGKKISAVVYYGVNDDKSFSVKRKIVWTMLRTIPNDIYASLIHEFTDDKKVTIVPGETIEINF